jgi:hypothetical protein
MTALGTMYDILGGRNYPNPQERNNLQDLGITAKITLK